MRLIIQFLAVAPGMVGSIMIASHTNIGQWGYVLFLLSSVATCVLLWNDKSQRAVLMLNQFYVGVNVFGLFRWFGVL